MQSVAKNIDLIEAQIRQVEQQSARAQNSVQLLAVSKGQPVEKIREAFLAGQQAFGENYLQEALEKIEMLHDLAIEWHFIGDVQTNKTRLIAENFAWVHGVTRLKVAERLNQQRPANLPPLNCCIEINISEEPSKAGIAADAVFSLAEQIQALPNINLRGLMTIAKQTNDHAQQLSYFTKMAELFQTAKAQGFNFDTLSMGMSSDYRAAIAAGSTMVRIGTAIFGPREKTHG